MMFYIVALFSSQPVTIATNSNQMEKYQINMVIAFHIINKNFKLKFAKIHINSNWMTTLLC